MASLQPSPRNGITAIIAGAGIGGLTAALELWRHGIAVRILERTAFSSTMGDVFLIGPSALRFLDHWPDMKQRHEEIVYHPRLVKVNHRGEALGPPINMSQVMGITKESLKNGMPSPTHHSRAKFHAMLLEQLTEIGIIVEYGKEASDYQEDDARGKGVVVLKDGSTLEADIIVAADGLRGASSRLILGHPVPAKSSGSAVYRCAYPVGFAVKDPLVAERFPLQEDGTSTFELWVGSGMFGTFWRTDESMMWSITHPDKSETADESWSNKVIPEEVLKFTSGIDGWPEVANRVIKATPPDTLINWKLMWRDPQPRWTSPGGRVVQLGDAAHSFLPSSGNGATQAIEDAISLAACISQVDRAGIPNALRVHNLLRFERVSFLQALGVARRDSRTQGPGQSKSKEPPTPGPWLYEHDPETYAVQNFQAASQSLKDGTLFVNTNKPSKVEYKPWTIQGLMLASESDKSTIMDGDWS